MVVDEDVSTILMHVSSHMLAATFDVLYFVFSFYNFCLAKYQDNNFGGLFVNTLLFLFLIAKYWQVISVQTVSRDTST